MPCISKFRITTLYLLGSQKILRKSANVKTKVLAIGRFDLTREIGDLSGHYTLLIQKFGKEWLIISDHSSAEN